MFSVTYGKHGVTKQHLPATQPRLLPAVRTVSEASQTDTRPVERTTFVVAGQSSNGLLAAGLKCSRNEIRYN